MDDNHFRLSIASLERLFGHHLDETVYTMYWNALGQLNDSEWHHAIQETVKSFVPSAQCPFPTIAHILKHVPERRTSEIYHRPLLPYEKKDYLPDENWVKSWAASTINSIGGKSDTDAT